MSEPHPSPRQRPGGRRVLRSVVQIIGFLGGLALLGWCARGALKPENRESLSRLGEAPWWIVGSMLALSAATPVLNGLLFGVLIRPVRKFRAADMVAVNTLCLFLNYMPFKLGAIFRIVYHTRRDRMPVLTIGAWLVAVAIVLLASLAIAAGAAFWRRGVDAWFVLAIVVGNITAWGAIVLVARLFRGPPGLAWLHRALDPLRLRPVQRLLTTRLFTDVHAGCDMLASPALVGAGMALRAGDATVQTCRFMLAAYVLGAPISPSDAVVLAIAYFLIGILSPFGMLGTREAGTAALATTLGVSGLDANTVFVMVMLVGATDAVATLAGAGISVAWLRPLRLLRPEPQVSPAP